MPSEKMAQFSSAPPLKMLKSAATEPPACVLTWVRNHSCSTAALTPGRRDLRARAHHDDDDEAEDDPGAKLGNLERIGESGKHGGGEEKEEVSGGGAKRCERV